VNPVSGSVSDEARRHIGFPFVGVALGVHRVRDQATVFGGTAGEVATEEHPGGQWVVGDGHYQVRSRSHESLCRS
jgi:hypothetical protein